MTYLAASMVVVGSLLGIVLTAATLPGTWLAVLVAMLCWWWKPDLFSWWTIAAAAALALVGEAIDLFASAAGAARTGGGRSAAMGSVVGGIAGAILGSMVFPIIGTIIGAVVGAGVGAAVAERGLRERTWRESAAVGAGAAAGKAVATVAKLVIAVGIAAVLSIAAFVP
jgi:uncharacterized protein YqgC (DUF456 family)